MGRVHASVSAGSGNWVASQAGVTGQSDCEIQCGNGYQSADSSATGSTAECEQECSLGSTPNFGYAPENSGRIAWDSSKQPNGGWSATCTTVVCNEGYDDNDDDNTCEKTEAGYYSAGQNRKTRTQCTLDGNTNQTKPKDDASWQGTGLVSAVACRWTCNSGHHISSDSTSCTINDCSSEINDGAGERTSHSGACQVTSCEAGFYEKTTGSCSEVEAVSGKYSPANNKGTTACSNTVTKPGTATWTNPTKSDDVGDCTWACNDGYARHLSACYIDTRVCDITDTNTNKVGEGSQSYRTGTTGDYTACEVTSCIAGYYKDPNAASLYSSGSQFRKVLPCQMI